MVSRFKNALNSGKFVIATEIGSPKGTNCEKMLRDIDLLKEEVDAINVTDHARSVLRFPSIGGCLAIKDQGGEPILQMACRDRNRLALQAELLLAYTRGISNVLCMTGDAISQGDHKDAKSIFDINSAQLVKAIRLMESGQDMGGNKLNGAVEFCVGATVNPEETAKERELTKFARKAEAGAEFFQTQPIFDLDNFSEFMEHARQFPVKILAGVLLVPSARMARFINGNIPGIHVPRDLINELDGLPKEEALDRGIEIAAQTISILKEGAICDGAHIMAIGKEHVVPEIIARAGIHTMIPEFWAVISEPGINEKYIGQLSRFFRNG